MYFTGQIYIFVTLALYVCWTQFYPFLKTLDPDQEECSAQKELILAYQSFNFGIILLWFFPYFSFPYFSTTWNPKNI